MFLGLSFGEILVIALFFITSFNCMLSYVCCSKALNVFEDGDSRKKALAKISKLDQNILSKVNLMIGLFYFGVGYLLINSLGINEYAFFLSCLLSFVLTLVTTFFSRLCYCYTCNLLLETKLNEFDCFILNVKRLVTIYLPFVIASLLVPTVYLLSVSNWLRLLLCILGFVLFLMCSLFFHKNGIP